ncbi:hypothetical protein D3C72_1223930 [compost metagenome]
MIGAGLEDLHARGVLAHAAVEAVAQVVGQHDGLGGHGAERQVVALAVRAGVGRKQVVQVGLGRALFRAHALGPGVLGVEAAVKGRLAVGHARHPLARVHVLDDVVAIEVVDGREHVVAGGVVVELLVPLGDERVEAVQERLARERVHLAVVGAGRAGRERVLRRGLPLLGGGGLDRLGARGCAHHGHPAAARKGPNGDCGRQGRSGHQENRLGTGVAQVATPTVGRDGGGTQVKNPL